MSQPTTIRFQHPATLTFRAPRITGAARTAASMVVWIVFAVVVVASIVAAVSSADEREAGIPERLTPPVTIERADRVAPAAGPVAASPRPAPAPHPVAD